MFDSSLTEILVFYALSPVHAGSGQAIAAVDLPIQRERHTGWPHVQSSGVKGAMRDHFRRHWEVNAVNDNQGQQLDKLVERIYGTSEGEEGTGQAGAISVTDARLLAFPVRSNVAPFVWVTCPAVLVRLQRDLALASEHMEFEVPEVKGHSFICPGNASFLGEKGDVILEDLVVKAAQNPPNVDEGLSALFGKLSSEITRLLIISDDDFSFLVRTATEVQPQIAINPETGTTVDGSLRYQELLPADSVLYTLVFFGQERIDGNRLAAQVIREYVLQAISSHMQIGGDMTLGRGITKLRWIPGQKTGGAV